MSAPLIPDPDLPPTIRAHPALALLLRCSRVAADPEGWKDDRAPVPGFDWQEVVTLADQHGLVPILHRRLAQEPIPGMTPEAWEGLTTLYQASQLRSRLLIAELLLLMGLLAGRGIRVIPYKGPALAMLAYGEAGLRPSNDLDLLIRQQDVPEALRLLQREGFTADLPALTPAREASLIDGGYHLELTSADGVVVVDLHWRLVPPRFPFRIDSRRLWARVEALTLAGQTVQGFAAEDALLFVAVHGTKDHWRKLLWLADIDRLVRAHADLDWAAVQEEARRGHAWRMLLLGLSLAHDLLHTPIPRDLQDAIRAEPAVARWAEVMYESLVGSSPPKSIVHDALYLTSLHLGICDGRLDRMRYVYRTLRTPDDADWERFPLPDALSALYLPLRLVRLGARSARELLSRLAVSR